LTSVSQALRSLGLGNFKKDLTPFQVISEFLSLAWYPKQIEETFERHLFKPRYIESEWHISRKVTFRFAPAWFQELLMRKAAGLVFLTARRGVGFCGRNEW
jgi:hypothetical protein